MDDLLIYRPPLGLGPTAALVAVALVAALWLYFTRQPELSPVRRTLMMAVRLAALSMVGWLLLGPSAYQDARQRSVPVPLIVLADTSASMAHCDMPASLAPGAVTDDDGRISRWDVVRTHWLNDTLITDLQSHATVSLFGFDRDFQPRRLSELAGLDRPDGIATDLFGALDKAMRSADTSRRGSRSADSAAHPGVIVLISDGHDTHRGSDPGLLTRLREQRWPVYPVALGSDVSARDVAVLAWAESDFLFAGQSTTIHATITHDGFVGQTVTVRLLYEGQPLETRRLRLDADRPSQVQFHVTPPPVVGRPISAHGYQVVVDPLPNERHTDNNHRWVFLQVSRDHIRVALFDAEPYWDTKFLVQAMREDPHVDITGVFALGPQRFYISRHLGVTGQSVPTELSLPITQQQLNSYDVVILGKGSELFFGGDRAAMLVDFVQQQGGALVLARGRAFGESAEGRRAQSLLSLIEPIEWGESAVTDLRMHLTPAGRASPLLTFDHARSAEAILTELPDMIAATRVMRERAASIVLLRQTAREGDVPPMAALAYQNAGAGQVLAVLNEGLWRWAFLPATMRQYESVYQQFWSRAVRWLATGGEFLPGQSVALALNQLMAEPGEEVTATVTVRHPPTADWQPSLRLIGPDGQGQPLTLQRTSEQPHRYVARLRPTEAGVHVVELTAPGTGSPGEPQRVTTRLAVYDTSVETMDPSARPQTLAAIAAATGGELLPVDRPDQLVQLVQRLSATRVSEPRMDYVFDRPEILAWLMVLFAVEWCMRRRSGVL